MSNKRVAAYCRVSTASEEQMASLREQELFFADYVRERGWTLYRIYADGGKSGTRLADRQAFARMMRDARCGAFELLLVKDISRMARNVIDFLQTVRTLKKLGIECRFLTANCSAGDGELFLTILAAVAQEESANLSKRVKFTKDRHARQGRVPNRVYGYTRENGELFDMKIDEKEAEIVRRIYRYALDGWGSRRIARLLQTEGAVTKNGNLFAESSVRQILANPLYAGILRTHRTEVVDYLTGERRKIPIAEQYTFLRFDLAIVSEDVWQKVQASCRTRQAMRAASGVLICGECNKPFRRRGQDMDTVWSCATQSRLGKDACPNRVRIAEKHLVYALQAWLNAYVTQDVWERATRAAAWQRDDLLRADRAYRARRRLQETLLLTGAITRTEYLRRIAVMEQDAPCATIETGAYNAREEILRLMATENVRMRWISRMYVDTNGRVTVFVRTPQTRKQSMLPAWETP